MKQEGDLSPFERDYVSIQVIAYWHPTPLLRWEKHYTTIDRVNYDKVLQQMWQSNTGLKEWRNVPEED